MKRKSCNRKNTLANESCAISLHDTDLFTSIENFNGRLFIGAGPERGRSVCDLNWTSSISMSFHVFMHLGSSVKVGNEYGSCKKR